MMALLDLTRQGRAKFPLKIPHIIVRTTASKSRMSATAIWPVSAGHLDDF